MSTENMKTGGRRLGATASGIVVLVVATTISAGSGVAQRQLFLDDFWVKEMSDITRTPHQPTKHPGNPVIHGDGRLLVYTRRGADNDHVCRHLAPLFMARVEPLRLCVLRATERIIVSERGVRLGNFGVVDIGPAETWVTVTVLRLDQKPGLAVPDDNEIHLALLFVPDGAQFEFTGPRICPFLHRLREVAGAQGLGAFCAALNAGPVSEKPSGLLAKCPGHVLVPGADREPVVQRAKGSDPVAYRVLADANRAGEKTRSR